MASSGRNALVVTTLGLDHLATWNEVRDALAALTREAFQLVSVRDGEVELEVDVSSGVGFLSEDLAWLRIANEARDSRLN
jgi:hypothetical protein